MNFNQWITCPNPQPDADFRLFCLPFAGGGASVYRSWSNHLGPKLEVCPIQLPGRENRISTPAIDDSGRLAEMIANQLSLYLSKPYLVYGHSMGGLLAYEALKHLQDQGHALPVTAFIGAHRAPHLPPRRRSFLDLGDREFIDKISSFGGFDAKWCNEELTLECSDHRVCCRRKVASPRTLLLWPKKFASRCTTFL